MLHNDNMRIHIYMHASELNAINVTILVQPLALLRSINTCIVRNDVEYEWLHYLLYSCGPVHPGQSLW